MSVNSSNLSRGICSINGHKVDLEEFSENCRKRGGHTKSSNLALAPPYFLLLQANLNSVNTNTASNLHLAASSTLHNPLRHRRRDSTPKMSTFPSCNHNLVSISPTADLTTQTTRTRRSVINLAINSDLKLSFPNHELLRCQHSKPGGPSSAQYYTPTSRPVPSPFSGASFHTVT
jgi:hypothetical protein